MQQRVIILPGNNAGNALWADELAKRFAQCYGVHVQAYKHWQQQVSDIDFISEQKRLADFLNREKGGHIVVAKSAGVLLALQAMRDRMLTPAALICIGLPLRYAAVRNIDIGHLLANIQTPTLFMQASGDPIGSAAEVAAIVPTGGLLVQMAGNTHDYADVDAIFSQAHAFIQENEAPK